MLLLLLACESVVDLSPPDTAMEDEVVSLRAGSWSGEAWLEVDFDWDMGPYCVGTAWAEVADDGSLEGGGLCSLQYGGSEGEEMDVDLRGQAGDEAVYVVAEFLGEERRAEPRALTVDSELGGFADTVYQAITGDEYAARMRLSLDR